MIMTLKDACKLVLIVRNLEIFVTTTFLVSMTLTVPLHGFLSLF